MEKISVHFTERERMLLAQLISEERDIENKKTGATDMKNKAEAWERVTRKFASEGCTPRSSKQLRKCWDNMKQKKRKLNTTIRHNRLMTGGGPAIGQSTDPVMEFIDATNPNLDMELNCQFDSTAVYEKEYNVQIGSTSTQRPAIQEIIEDENENEEDIDDVSPYESITIVNSTSKKGVTSKSKNLMNCSEKELRLIKLREAIEQQRELHAKKMAIAEAEEKIVLLKLLREEAAFEHT